VVEANDATYPRFSDSLYGEMLVQEQAAAELVQQQRAVRAQIGQLEHSSAEAKANAADLRETQRFLGRLEQALTLYDRSDDTSPLAGEVAELREKLEE